ncbi:uncharacterized protein CMU_025740 [Cryptosporidium muris RN66]|uniref:Uncharacterized protein n=1 Tax=Cryptosporidium muris (strain RN66) TaxID=441375 RepID=B6AB15_CRYMR|nr:uncharacterized protein CMU_025740 [Cryptosporidium muris RN66]EEA05567.1 hypothetical protein, conserved [Cryptosporidium muris RN66]|eukprot:XP_002139916.1 hypothetical protein [Cryptosporidium muris RN66]
MTLYLRSKYFAVFLFLYTVKLVRCVYQTPEYTVNRINLLFQRFLIESNIKINYEITKSLARSLDLTAGETFHDQFQTVIDDCEKKTSSTLSATGNNASLSRSICKNVLHEHVKLVLNRQHFAENIYEVISNSLQEIPSNNTKSPNEQSYPLKNSIFITPEVSYLISDLLPLNPSLEQCVESILRVLSLPFGFTESQANIVCKDILEMRRIRGYYCSKDKIPNNLQYIFPKKSDNSCSKYKIKLTPFKSVPETLNFESFDIIGGLSCNNNKISIESDTIIKKPNLLFLPFINSPVISIKKSERSLKYNMGKSSISPELLTESVTEVQELKVSEKLIFNDDIYTDLILPCKLLTYEEKILASMLVFISNSMQLPLDAIEACIVITRTVTSSTIVVPNQNDISQQKAGIISTQIINFFIPTCINSLLTISIFVPLSNFANSYLAPLETSESATKILGKICGKVMENFVDIFGTISIEQQFECNIIHTLIINSLQEQIWNKAGALFTTRELSNIVCKLNFEYSVSQVVSDCSILFSKYIKEIPKDLVSTICQSILSYVQPQPLVVRPIIYTITSILSELVNSVNQYAKKSIRSLIDIGTQILDSCLGREDCIESYESSCKKAFLDLSSIEGMTISEIEFICGNSKSLVIKVLSNFSIPEYLLKYHKAQFKSRIAIIQSNISIYSKIQEKTGEQLLS